MNFQPPTPSFQHPPTQGFQPQAQVQQRPASAVPEPEPVAKGPIPAEHQLIKSTFDTLLDKCLQSTNAPVVRRKLDDVGKKLEVLYDKLRDSSVRFI